MSMSGLSSTEPTNLSTAKAAVTRYYESGQYRRDLEKVAAEVSAWLEKRAKKPAKGERLAVVFDVDETVLSNFPHMQSLDFGYTLDDWHGWVQKAEAPAIEPMRDVMMRARELDYTVFFVTGRAEPAEHAGTAANLFQEAMGDYERLMMKSVDDKRPTARRKAAQRAEIEEAGYTIVATIGDQWSDLEGGHAEKAFKVPNPFYEIP